MQGRKLHLQTVYPPALTLQRNAVFMGQKFKTHMVHCWSNCLPLWERSRRPNSFWAPVHIWNTTWSSRLLAGPLLMLGLRLFYSKHTPRRDGIHWWVHPTNVQQPGVVGSPERHAGLCHTEWQGPRIWSFSIVFTEILGLKSKLLYGIPVKSTALQTLQII